MHQTRVTTMPMLHTANTMSNASAMPTPLSCKFDAKGAAEVSQLQPRDWLPAQAQERRVLLIWRDSQSARYGGTLLNRVLCDRDETHAVYWQANCFFLWGVEPKEGEYRSCRQDFSYLLIDTIQTEPLTPFVPDASKRLRRF